MYIYIQGSIHEGVLLDNKDKWEIAYIKDMSCCKREAVESI